MSVVSDLLQKFRNEYSTAAIGLLGVAAGAVVTGLAMSRRESCDVEVSTKDGKRLYVRGGCNDMQRAAQIAKELAESIA